MAAATGLILASFIAITRVPSPAWAIALISVAMFSHGAWANITLPAEVFPRHVVGSVTGFGGALGSSLAAFVTLVIGRMLTSVSFTPIFLVYSAAPVVAFLIVPLADQGPRPHPLHTGLIRYSAFPGAERASVFVPALSAEKRKTRGGQVEKDCGG